MWKHGWYLQKYKIPVQEFTHSWDKSYKQTRIKCVHHDKSWAYASIINKSTVSNIDGLKES